MKAPARGKPPARRARPADPAVASGGARGLALALLLSGAAGLVLEVTWARWFRLLLGATAPAASAAVIAFLIGNALGATLVARRLTRLADPLRAYVVAELGVAVTAAAVPFALDALSLPLVARYDAWLESPAQLTALRFGVALAATLPAAVCLGATWPLAVAAILRHRSVARADAATGLYAAHIAGGVVGAALAGLWLPARIGVAGSYAVGIAAALAAAAVAALRRRPAAPPPARSATPRARTPAAAVSALHPGALVALAIGSGFGTFALQILAVQAFAQVLDQSTLAFAWVLAVVLAALALAAAGVRAGLRRVGPADGLAWALGAAAIATLVFPAGLEAATGGLGYVAPAEGGSHAAAALWRIAATAGPVFLFAGAVFPLVLAAAAGLDDGPGRSAARLAGLAAANTAGAVAGAWCAPYLLLPAVGLWPAFLGLAVAYAVPAAWMTPIGARSGGLRLVLLAAAWVAAMSWASPLRVPLVRTAEDERLLSLETTASGSVAVVERDGERLIRTDNHYALGGTGELLHERRQGHLPLVLHGDPRRVAFVGSATGITAGAALRHPVEELTLVELVPAVARAARAFFADANAGVHHDPRTRVVVDDARNFLASTRHRFDVVVADLFVPWRAGTGGLYTREHFHAVRQHLAPGGLFCQWLALYQLTPAELEIVTATFLDVFPEAALFRGDFYGRYPIVALVGWRDGAPEPATITAAARRLGARDAGEPLADRWVGHPAGIFALYVGPLAPLRPRLADVPRNRDDRPEIELRSARSHRGGAGILRPATGAEWLRFAAPLQAARAGALPPFGALPPGPAASAAAGDGLQRAGVAYAEGRLRAAAEAFAEAAHALPAELVRAAAPDPSVADLWLDPR